MLVCVSDAVKTPNCVASEPEQAGELSDMTMNPPQVVREALRKQSYVIPGRINRISSFVMHHLLPRKAAVKFMGRILKGMYVE